MFIRTGFYDEHGEKRNPISLPMKPSEWMAENPSRQCRAVTDAYEVIHYPGCGGSSVPHSGKAVEVPRKWKWGGRASVGFNPDAGYTRYYAYSYGDEDEEGFLAKVLEDEDQRWLDARKYEIFSETVLNALERAIIIAKAKHLSAMDAILAVVGNDSPLNPMTFHVFERSVGMPIEGYGYPYPKNRALTQDPRNAVGYLKGAINFLRVLPRY